MDNQKEEEGASCDYDLIARVGQWGERDGTKRNRKDDPRTSVLERQTYCGSEKAFNPKTQTCMKGQYSHPRIPVSQRDPWMSSKQSHDEQEKHFLKSCSKVKSVTGSLEPSISRS